MIALIFCCSLARGRGALAAFLTLFVFSLGAHAQAPARSASLRFLFLDESSGDYFVKVGAAFTNLGAKPYVVSPSFDFPPDTRLELYKQLADPKTGELVRTRVINLTVSASPTHALAVITPTPDIAEDGTRSYRSRLYDIAPDKTPPRSIRILNLSPSPMAARFGTDQIEILSGAERLVTPAVDKRNRIRVYVASQGVGEWQMIFNSFLSLQENSRMTGIVVHSPSGLRHTYTKEELDTLGAPKPGFFWLYFTETKS